MVSVVLRKLGLAACVLGVLGAFLSLPASTTAQQVLPQESGPEDSLPTLSAEEIEQNEEDERVLQAIMAEGIKVVPLSASASLHNAGFDNNDWYEFNERYGHYLAGTWLPDDDNNSKNNIPLSSRQDWRLWYQQGKYVLEADPEAKYVKNEEAVQIRPYGIVWNTGNQVGGIYQIVYGTTPCLDYKFSIYGQTRFEPPESDYVDPPSDWVNVMKAGIDRSGWYLPTDDPALEGAAFPSTTVWGPSVESQWSYNQMSVTAEAWSDKVTVFTYSDLNGGRSARTLWDSASFEEVTDRIYDPNSYVATGGLSDPQYYNSTVTWTSAYSGISQVYYRVKPTSIVSPTTPLTYSIYLPLVSSNTEPWSVTTVNRVPSTAHLATLTGLQSGTTYEYFVVTKGLFGGSCTTWVSPKKELTIP